MRNAFQKDSVSGSGDVKVAASDAATFKSALELLAGDAYVERARNTEWLEHVQVLVANLENRVVGAIAVQVAPGHVGWIWPAVVGYGDADSIASKETSQQLVAAGVARLAEADCRLAQALLYPSEPRSRDFEANGFVRIAEMIRMQRDCRARPDSWHDASGLEFVAFGSATERAFERVIARTYAGSLDCPELDGLRSVSEALESYKGTDTFRPELWQLARRGGDEVGCVLLAYFPDESRCELQYMGVVPQARGQKLGRILCERALLQADGIGACRMSLSVDSRNRPALDQYRSLGFAEIDRREVYLRRLSTAADGDELCTI